MGKPNQEPHPAGSLSTGHIRALSWNIATEPKLYKELAPNPYTHHARKIISERFSQAREVDVIRAVTLAEPEGKYDRNFKLLSKTRQEEELVKQKAISVEINKRLVHYCKNHAKEFDQLSSELIYNSLSRVIFETADLKEIEQRYAQKQRQHFRLTIVNFIEHLKHLNASRPPKKSYLRRPLLGALVALGLLLLFAFTCRQIQNIMHHQEEKKRNVALVAHQETQKFPVRLKIPKINVDAFIEYVGLTPEGEMAVPSNTTDVGWYQLGSTPGQIGSAVISGHFDGRKGEFGVFNKLEELQPGDKLYVVNALGITTTFVVRESRVYEPGYAEEVFFPKDNGRHLNLVTCDGAWDKTKKGYSKRLVVFTDIQP